MNSQWMLVVQNINCQGKKKRKKKEKKTYGYVRSRLICWPLEIYEWKMLLAVDFLMMFYLHLKEDPFS
jgi:hypothetical protein